METKTAPAPALVHPATPESVRRAPQYITIAEPDDTFPWQYTDPDTKDKLATVFHLRVVPEEVQKEFRKRHTKVVWDAGRRVEDIDWVAFTEDALDYAITHWEGLKAKGGRDLPCERPYKKLLPDRVQAEIVKLCVGKELGREAASSDPNRP